MWTNSIESDAILMAFALTLLAGLSTGIGGAIAFFAKRTNTKLLSVSLGLSAGVMIYVSFVELFPEACKSLTSEFGNVLGNWVAVIGFFGGIALSAVIDMLVPMYENPHEMHHIEEMGSDVLKCHRNKLMRLGVFSALALALHNFPEGLATFVAVLKDPHLGISVAIAIAIHNIPEGIAVSVPIFYATGSKKKAFWYSFLSGLAEPLGALIGFALLFPFINDIVFGILFTVVAGIMVYISFDELLPAAQEYGEHHHAIGGLIAGMAIMAISLLMFL